MSQERPRVLIVEDTKENRTLLSMILRQEGYEVDLAVDGKAGVAQVISHDYSVVLMDLMMPNWDGRTAIKAIEQGKPGTKIIVMTAARDDELKKSILQSHPCVVGWIDKPWPSLEEVKKRVREVIHPGT